MDVRRFSIAAGLALSLAALAKGGVTVTPIPDSGSSIPEAPAPSAPAGTNIPTADEVQSLVDAGKYHEALQQLLRLLDIHGAAATFDRAQMLILRAECQLQIHEQSSAIGTLQDAARTATASGNAEDAENARAFAYLIQKSQHDAYAPITGVDHTPLDILNRSTRSAAYKAAFTDFLNLMNQKISGANANGSIMPLIDVGHDFPTLRGLERQGTGATTQSDAFAKTTSQTASRLINAVLSESNAKISTIGSAANHVITDGTSQYGRHYHFVGLTQEQVQTLDQIVDTCGKIQKAVEELSKSFANTPVFSSLASAADSTSQRALAIRNKNYAIP